MTCAQHWGTPSSDDGRGSPKYQFGVPRWLAAACAALLPVMQAAGAVLQASAVYTDPVTQRQCVARSNVLTLRLRGDVNGDDRHTTVDAVLILRAAVGLRDMTVDEGDADGDGRISILDALSILRWAVSR